MENFLEPLVERNGVRECIERSPILDPSASYVDSTDSKYDPADISAKFHAFDNVSDFKVTENDLLGDFKNDDLGEYAT